jgi:hypothetical protein
MLRNRASPQSSFKQTISSIRLFFSFVLIQRNKRSTWKLKRKNYLIATAEPFVLRPSADCCRSAFRCFFLFLFKGEFFRFYCSFICRCMKNVDWNAWPLVLIAEERSIYHTIIILAVNFIYQSLLFSFVLIQRNRSNLKIKSAKTTSS